MRSSMSTRGLYLAVAVIGVALWGPAARAERAADPPQAQRDAQQQAAYEHFRDGLELHHRLLFEDAALAYQRALNGWQHPKFYLYLSHALARSGAPLRAFTALQQALAGDPKALDAQDTRTAQVVEAELVQQLAAITVRCDADGAEVTINDQIWFSCPGERRKMVRPGFYLVDVRQAGHVPVSQSMTLRAGEWAVVEPNLVAKEDAVRVERRWPRALPWGVGLAGIAIAAVGATNYARAARDIDGLQRDIDGLCAPGARRCPSSAEIDDKYDGARFRQIVGVGLLTAGTGTLLTALLMRLQTRDVADESVRRPSVEVLPLMEGSAAGLSLDIEF